MKKKVYVLGNPLVDVDSLPIKLLPILQHLCPQFYFEMLDPSEELHLENNQEVIFIDSVVGIDKVTVFNDLSHFIYSPRVTVHDYDLLVNLKLLQKLGRLKKFTIIGVPVKGNLKKIAKDVEEKINI